MSDQFKTLKYALGPKALPSNQRWLKNLLQRHAHKLRPRELHIINLRLYAQLNLWRTAEAEQPGNPVSGGRIKQLEDRALRRLLRAYKEDE